MKYPEAHQPPGPSSRLPPLRLFRPWMLSAMQRITSKTLLTDYGIQFSGSLLDIPLIHPTEAIPLFMKGFCVGLRSDSDLKLEEA